jgi:hypothetical protein
MRRSTIAVLVAAGVVALGGSAEAHGPRAGVGAVVRSPLAVTRPFPARPRAFPHRFHAFPRSFAIVNPYPLYVAPPAVYVAPPVSYGAQAYAAPLTSPGTTYLGAAPGAEATPSVVYYPHGRYELRGDGINVPYVWVWIPNPPPPPPDPATSLGS